MPVPEHRAHLESKCPVAPITRAQDTQMRISPEGRRSVLLSLEPQGQPWKMQNMGEETGNSVRKLGGNLRTLSRAAADKG